MSNALTMAAGGQIDGLLSKPDQAAPRTASGAARAASEAPVAKGKLRRDQKAAIVLRILGDEGAKLPLGNADAPQLARLVRAMAGLRHVDETTTLDVIREFLTDVTSLGLYFRPGLESATEALGSHMTDSVRALLADRIEDDAPRDPWLVVANQPPELLARLLASETAHVAALTLARLSPRKAAELLDILPADVARQAMLAALGPDGFSADTIARIGAALAEGAEQAQRRGPLSGTAVDRVGAILNFASGHTREKLLSSLESSDEELAEKVRRVMFTFADIPDRVEVKDVAKLVRAVPNDVFFRAMAGALIREKETADFLFANLSKRLSKQLAEEVRELGEVKPKDADAAMNAVVQAARDLEAAGEITLIAPGE